MFDVSVIICTHNPRTDYLVQTLGGLSAQTLPFHQWELLVVDNGSDTPLQARCDISFNPNARIVREERLGLTSARLRGICETHAELIVFVDDDNVLNPDYLEQALQISKEWPILGAWGGQVFPCYEIEPPAWIEPYRGHLAIRQLKRDIWSNEGHEGGATPIGAGMVVRRQVADEYSEKVRVDKNRLTLDRRGRDLTSGGDIDLALTAIDLGLGTGLFTRLKLTHLISADRLSEGHLLKLQEKISFSGALLGGIRGFGISPPRRSRLGYVRDALHLLRMDRRARRFELAKRRGLATAHKVLRAHGQ